MGEERPDRESLLRDAQRALDLVEHSPREALATAEAVIAHIPRQRPPEATATAQRAAALALRNLGDLPAAEARLRTAIRSAAGRAPRAAAEARMSLAFVLLEEGHPRRALREADRAAGGLTGLAAARLSSQRALILQRCGRVDEALDAYAAALPVLRRENDRIWEARLRNNRGLLYAYRGAFSSATEDLDHALGLAEFLKADMLMAESRWNLGFVASLRGELIDALRAYDAAGDALEALGLPDARLALDRCAVLLKVGLHEEALVAATTAVALLSRGGAHADAAEGLILQAQAELELLATDEAEAHAKQAAAMFDEQSRPGWGLLARFVALRAEAHHQASPHVLRSAVTLAEALAEAGWREEHLEALLIAARSAIESGDTTRAEALLVRARAARRQTSVALRARGWYAEAVLRRERGQDAAALRAVNSGLTLVRQAQDLLAATELKAHVAIHGERLAELGLRLAVESGRPRAVLKQAEHFRAGGLARPPTRPPADPAMAALLADLRLATVAEDERRLVGSSDAQPSANRATLERRIRAAARTAHGPSAPERARIDISAVAGSLGARTLVEYVVLDDRVRAVTLVDGRARLHDLARLSEIRIEIESLRFALSRTLAGESEVSTSMLRHSSRRLDEMVIRPIEQLLGSDLVISPSGPLQSLPWAAMPSLRHRAVSVVPSVSHWFAADAYDRSVTGSVVCIAGPDLRSADTEVAAISQMYADVVTLTGADATAEAAIEAMDQASVVHIAAHGVLRADNPMFSSLLLAGGPLTVYDLERLRAVPPLVVLPACRSAVGVVRSGDEIIGLAAALLALGARTVVAAVVPVPDAPTSDLMTSFHRFLLAGSTPRAALSEASSAALADGSGVGQAFVALGRD